MNVDLEKIAQFKGNGRGAIAYAHGLFIEKKEGEKGLAALEKKMAELGHPINFKKIKVGGWYPEYLNALTILTAKDLFSWTEKDVFEMGASTPKNSFITKILMKYFLSLKSFMKEVPRYWKKHLDFGALEVIQFSEEKKYMILHEKGYKLHPIMCIYHAGFYRESAKYIIKSKEISIEETKCVFKGDPHNEYVIKWE